MLVLALAATAGLGLAACAPRPSAPAAQQSGLQPGGPFQLIDQDGRPTDQRVLNGKWSVVFFGYTFCPDYCPTTLTTLGRAMTLLGPRAAKVQVVFVTVDPARDTPAALKTYLSSKVFPRNAIGLTGTPAEVAKAAKAYMVFYQKEGAGANYTMDHSTALYLMNPKGQFDTVIADGLSPRQQADQIVRAMAGT
ncbi:MAG TPA: SCO family protein [Caulobacteraceae bacterium]|nr:SCO family protein [Caulobacteraceae bacterium]